MGILVTVVRLPFGLAASIILIMWSLLIAAIYLIAFVFLAVFSRLRQIDHSLNPWLGNFNGAKFLPGIWGWVFRPSQGIFEENSVSCISPENEDERGNLLSRLKAAAEGSRRNDGNGED